MKKITYICMLVLIIEACNSKQIVSNLQDNNTDFKFNEKVTLTGIYTKSIIAKKEEGKHWGYYKIIVNDSLEVNLLPPYHNEAVRPKQEVQEFEGKKVVVTGFITENTAFSEPSLENQPTTVSIPCFITIESIHLSEE